MSAWSKNGYTCWDCTFYEDGKCELLDKRVSANKQACKEFELG